MVLEIKRILGDIFYLAAARTLAAIHYSCNKPNIKQNELLMALLQSNLNIEKKPVLTEGDIGQAVSRFDSKEMSKHNIFTGRPAY